jgi:hypothetical protein
MTTHYRNIVNPPNPLLRIYLFVFMVLISMNSTIGKDIDSLPRLPDMEDLQLSVKTYHNKKLTAELQELEIKDKGKILKYLPTVGLTFGLPSISWGTEKIANIKQQKAIIEAKRKSLEMDNTLKMNDDLGKLSIMYHNINYLISNIDSDKELIQVEKDLFQIYEKQYQNHEITPTEYLQKKKAYLLVNQQFRNRIEDIRKLINELLLFCHYNTPNQDIYFTANK